VIGVTVLSHWPRERIERAIAAHGKPRILRPGQRPSEPVLAEHEYLYDSFWSCASGSGDNRLVGFGLTPEGAFIYWMHSVEYAAERAA
jgi:hypothetical protein